MNAEERNVSGSTIEVDRRDQRLLLADDERERVRERAERRR